MRICLTGSTGFVGKKLSKHLLKNNHQISAPIRNVNLEILPQHKNLNFIHAEDIGIDKDYSQSLTKVDLVIHCAARAHIMRENKNDCLQLYREVNVYDTLNLAKQAAIHGVRRFIFLSSIKVNGERTLTSNSFKHDDIPKPEDPYGISKFEAEEALRSLSNKTGMELVIIRAPLVYGEEVKGNFLRLLNLCNKDIPLPFANINNTRSMVYIDNFVDLIECCIDHPKAAGEIFLVSDEQDISTTELIKKIKKFMNKPERLFPLPLFFFKLLGTLIGKSSEVNRLLGSLKIDISHARNVLGWKPIINLEEGLKKTVNWYLKNL
jgi:nucleoside-diphosphate-sugar epimerase